MAQYYLIKSILIACGISDYRMIPLFKIALIIAILHLHNLNGEVFQKKTVEPDAFRYRNKAHNFSLYLPKAWALTEGKNGAAIMAVRPAMTPKEAFRENVSVVVQRIRPGISLKEWIKENIPQLKKALFGFYMTEQGVLKPGRGEGGWIIYGYENNRRALKLLQNFVLLNGYAYTITGAASSLTFSRYRPIFQAMADSLKVGE